jgi:MerR HTH family regulatory protein
MRAASARCSDNRSTDQAVDMKATAVSPGSGSGGGEEARPPGIYSIGAVASMLGLPPATLRTWEERYGVVSPARTPAGQRLYSRSELDKLRFVSDAVERGMDGRGRRRSGLAARTTASRCWGGFWRRSMGMALAWGLSNQYVGSCGPGAGNRASSLTPLRLVMSASARPN